MQHGANSRSLPAWGDCHIAHAITRTCAVLLACACSALWTEPSLAQHSPSPSVKQVGRILSVRKVLRSSIVSTTRSSRIHDFDVYFSIHIADQSYCGDYETPVLDEINDLLASSGKLVRLRLDEHKNRITLYTPHYRRLKAHIVRPSHCSSTSLAQSTLVK